MCVCRSGRVADLQFEATCCVAACALDECSIALCWRVCHFYITTGINWFGCSKNKVLTNLGKCWSELSL